MSELGPPEEIKDLMERFVSTPETQHLKKYSAQDAAGAIEVAWYRGRISREAKLVKAKRALQNRALRPFNCIRSNEIVRCNCIRCKAIKDIEGTG